MEFKNPDNHFLFILVTAFILLGVYSYMLIFNYYDIPKTSEVHFIYGVDDYDSPFLVKPFNWAVSFTDKVQSNFESIIIYVCMLWGFMRLIDLMRFLGFAQ